MRTGKSYVYILRSKKKGSYYIGCTSNVPARLSQHNSGLVLSTKHGRPWILIHKEEFDSLSEARSREKQIKNWKSRAAIERLLKR